MRAAKTMRRLAAVVAAGVLAGPMIAEAGPPETSLLPQPRASAGAALPDPAAAGAPAASLAGLALARPAPRPAGPAAQVASEPAAEAAPALLPQPIAPQSRPADRIAAAPAAVEPASDVLLDRARRDGAMRLAQAGHLSPDKVAAAGPDTLRPLARPADRVAAATPETAADSEVAGRGQAAPLELALRPQPRPEAPAGRLAPASASAASLAARAAVAAISPQAVAQSRVPRTRPEAERRQFLQRVAAVRTQPAPGAIAGRTTGNLCGVQGIQGSTIPPIAGRVQGCGVANPVRVTAVDGVRLSQSAVMDCDTARALHTWVRTGLRPAVGRLGGGPERLNVAGHYVCRTQNHRPGARISEHGRGRAIDISGVRLADGRTLNVLQHWRHGNYGPILRAAHQAACGPFTTTLGPGSDGMHEDHLHFDLRQGRRLCR